MKKILQFILKWMSVAVIWKYKPIVIGVTGSVGKTGTKDAIHIVLSKKYSVRSNYRNYNTEIGVPLTIIGTESGGKSIFLWLSVFWKFCRMMIGYVNYPQVLVLEMAADKPGDIKYLTNIAKPNIGVISAVGNIPVHVEFFNSPAQVLKEKASLVLSLPKEGLAILNYDDEKVRGLKDKIKSKKMTFGFEEHADLRAVYYNFDEESGVSFKIDYKGSTVPFRLPKIIGRQQVYAVLAATCVGFHFGMNALEIAEAVKNFQGLPGRLRLLKGVKNTFIIDDSYNASPTSTLAALNSLAQFGKRRKIAVLGDMLELGRYTEEAHRKIGDKAIKICNLIFTVGERARFIAEQAEKNGFDKNNIFSFRSSNDAKIEVQKQLKEGDVVLVKGSRGMRMEKVVQEIMADAQKACDLLVSCE